MGNPLIGDKVKVEYNKYKPSEKLGSYIWEFHLTDADDFPSVLHAHAIGSALKLDGNTGTIYDAKTRQKEGSLRTKELKKLHRNKEFQHFAYRRIETYNKMNPYKAVQIPGWIGITARMRHRQSENVSTVFRICYREAI